MDVLPFVPVDVCRLSRTTTTIGRVLGQCTSSRRLHFITQRETQLDHLFEEMRPASPVAT